jgi:putative oxygen-independent coproporphyrinogen III oxidase
VELGVYIHFPWCRRRCPYCDFAIAVAPDEKIPHEPYADAVLAELAARAGRFAGRRLVSIYFGGGTPALWRPDQIARVIGRVRETFDGGTDLEISVEANPNDATAAALAALRDAGVNRLSVGTQSFEDAELVQLGRDHDARHALTAVSLARAAGFRSVSLDLIYALPGRSLADWERTLARAVELEPDHLSVYQLTVEPRTTFGAAARTGRLIPTEDDLAAEQFETAHRVLGQAGYEHYEVSSYARPGRRSRHNSLYWHGAAYLGLGNGAHSFLAGEEGGTRWSNHRSVRRYLAGTASEGELAQDPLVAEVTTQDRRGLIEDAIWLGLRTSDGISRTLVDGKRGLPRLLAAGLVEAVDDRIRPTAKGLLFADEIGANLLE